MSGLEEGTRRLAQKLGALSGMGHEFAQHYAVRLAVLVGDKSLQYLDTTLDREALADWEVVLLDDEKVIHMHVQVPADPSDERTVTVDAWARSTLQTMQIPAARGQNDVVWGSVPGTGWPAGASIRLSYAGRSEPLELPLGASDSTFQARALAAVLPSLLGDLTATL